LVWEFIPIEGLSRLRVYYRRLVSREALLIRILIIIKPGSEINQQGRFIGYGLCAVPVDARDSY
jgi:hypothetical protein